MLVLNTIICFVLLFLSDKYGRKPLLFTGVGFIAIGMTISLVAPNLFVKILGISMALGAEGAFSAFFPMFINESSCKNFQKK